MKFKKGGWTSKGGNQKKWQDDIMPLLETFTDRTPGTFIEEKRNSLVWHYRKTDPELASERVVEFKTVLNSLASDELQILDIVKGIEVSRGTINKGKSVIDILSEKKYDFIYICHRDDINDCSVKEWVAFNKNLGLAEQCFDILCGKLNMKGLLIGRAGCAVPEKIKHNLDVTAKLDYFTMMINGILLLKIA